MLFAAYALAQAFQRYFYALLPCRCCFSLRHAAGTDTRRATMLPPRAIISLLCYADFRLMLRRAPEARGAFDFFIFLALPEDIDMLHYGALADAAATPRHAVSVTSRRAFAYASTLVAMPLADMFLITLLRLLTRARYAIDTPRLMPRRRAIAA